MSSSSILPLISCKLLISRQEAQRCAEERVRYVIRQFGVAGNNLVHGAGHRSGSLPRALTLRRRT